VNPDWPQAPCYGSPYPDLATQIADWKGYYHYKGQEWMESKKTEMNEAIQNNSLKKWIQDGHTKTEFGDINPNEMAWRYYYLNGQAPHIDEKCIKISTKLDAKCIKQPTPRQQLKLGTLSSHILCNEGLELIFKSSDDSPACIRPATFPYLVERGFTDPPPIKAPDSREFVFITCPTTSFTVEELVNQSQYIIVGTVSGYFGSPAPVIDTIHNQTTIYTRYPISIEQDLTHQYTDDLIVVRTLGGGFEDLTVISDCDAELNINDKVILFVSDKKSESDYDTFSIVGEKAGVYMIKENKAFGNNYPEGIDMNEFLTKIQNVRNLN
jgi:hypothetical protein